MNKTELYQKLPHTLRGIAASAWGYYLRWWRYSSQTERLVNEALERDGWSSEKIVSWQTDQLSEMLDQAAKKVPYYRDLWAERRKAGDNRRWDQLENWPVLKKDIVRQNPKLFISDDHTLHRLYAEHTSGTTGSPLTVYMSRSALIGWYSLVEARMRRWHGVNQHTPWAILGGQLVVPAGCNNPPFWIWNQAFHQLYLSSYHIARRHIPAYMQAMQQYGVEYLLGYPSALAALAHFARESNCEAPQLKIILSNAEPLYESQRAVIEEVFGCRVLNTYGMSENVSGGSECNAGNLHLWPEAGVVEIFGDFEDYSTSAGEAGRMICTGLLNRAMPLIRYEVGDRGCLGGTNCGCGRHLSILQGVEGRIDDVLLTPDGRMVGRLDPVFKADLPILEAQIVQEAINFIVVKVVAKEAFGPNEEQDLIQRIKQRMGNDVCVTVEIVKEIPRAKNGKFKAVISKVKRAEWAR